MQGDTRMTVGFEETPAMGTGDRLRLNSLITAGTVGHGRKSANSGFQLHEPHSTQDLPEHLSDLLSESTRYLNLFCLKSLRFDTMEL